MHCCVVMGRLVLCYLEGATQEAAAVQLGVAKSTLRERLERGRALLRTKLVCRGLGSAAVLVAAAWPAASASAGVPMSLIVSTVKAASLFAAGRTAAGVISPTLAALTEGVLKTMMMNKLKAVVALVLLLGFMVTGATVLTLGMAAVQGDKPMLAQDKPVPKDGAKPQPAKPVVVREQALLQRMAMSPDGEVMATVGVTFDGSSYNSTVKLWDARTGKLKQALDEEKDSHLNIAVSRDFLAIGVSSTLSPAKRGPVEVRLLDAKTLELRQKIDGLSGRLAFSQNGKRLAVAGFAEGGFVKLWDVEKQKLIEGNIGEIPRELDGDANQVNSLVYSPDGKLVSTAWDDGKIRLFDGQTGDFRTLLDPEAGVRHGITGLAFSLDSKTLVSKGRDNTVVLWDLKEGKPGRTLKGHKLAMHDTSVSAVAFSGDGKLIATGAGAEKYGDYEVILWDAKTGEVRQTFSGLTQPVHVIAFSPDGKALAVCGGAGRGRGDDTKTSGEITLFPLE